MPLQLNFLRLLLRASSSVRRKKPGVKPAAKRRVSSLVHSDPELLSMWLGIRKTYFPERPDLDDVTISWSNRRQKRVLASVSIRQKKVRVAKELNVPECQKWLDPLLYHEMCHAVLGEGVPVRNFKRQWHGDLFKSLEQRHPLMREFEDWIKKGGWLAAVRSARAKQVWTKRRLQK